MRGNSKAAAARKPRKQDLFLKALTETVNVTLSCRKAGVPRRTVYDWREADAAFARRWDEALEEGIDLLEAEAHRRAFEGVERPVYYKGERVGEWRHYSDALATFLLRAHRPEKYRDAPKAGASAEEDKAEEKTEEGNRVRTQGPGLPGDDGRYLGEGQGQAGGRVRAGVARTGRGPAPPAPAQLAAGGPSCKVATAPGGRTPAGGSTTSTASPTRRGGACPSA